MPINYQVDEDANFIHVDVSGVINEEDLLQYQRAIMSDTRVKPSFRLLFDCRTAVAGTIPEKAIDAIVELDAKFREKCPGRRTAIVVSEKTGFTLAKQFEKKAQPDVIVFFNLDVAKIWLGYEGSLG